MAVAASSTDASRALTSGARFSPEFRILLAACSAPQSALSREWLSQLDAASLDWNRVLELAEHHGVLPALAQRFAAPDPSTAVDIPEPVRAELTRRFALMAHKKLRLAAELIHILSCLEQAGVEALPHKGPALAEFLYGDLAQRDFSDLDLLIRAQDVGRAHAALATIGYKPHFELTGKQLQSFVREGYESACDGPAGKNLLELQWQLVPRYFSVDFDMPAIFGRATPCSVAGRPVRTLAGEDLLLALAVHAAKHLWGRLCWLRDLAALVERTSEREGFDWQNVFSNAEDLGMARILAVTLLLCRDLLGVSAPESALQLAARDPETSVLASRIAAHIPSAEDFNPESVAFFRWMLRLRERPADRRRFLARLAFTPGVGEWSAIHLPDSLFPLYRFVRLARLSTRLLGLR
jgi:hypothetical protein